MKSKIKQLSLFLSFLIGLSTMAVNAATPLNKALEKELKEDYRKLILDVFFLYAIPFYKDQGLVPDYSFSDIVNLLTIACKAQTQLIMIAPGLLQQETDQIVENFQSKHTIEHINQINPNCPYLRTNLDLCLGSSILLTKNEVEELYQKWEYLYNYDEISTLKHCKENVFSKEAFKPYARAVENHLKEDKPDEL